MWTTAFTSIELRGGFAGLPSCLGFGSREQQSVPASERVLRGQILDFCRQRISRGELASADSEDGTSQDCTDSNLHLASTARAVTTKRRIGRFPFFSFSGIRLGLIGRNSPYGLGHQHRDLVDRLKVRAWLAPFAPEDSAQPCPRQCEIVPRAASPEFFSAFLNRIDVLMFVERPPFESLVSMARERGYSSCLRTKLGVDYAVDDVALRGRPHAVSMSQDV